MMQKIARAIVVRWQLVASLVGAVVALLVSFGVLPTGASDDVRQVLGVALMVVSAIAGAAVAQSKTTPADPALHPLSSNGVPLVEAPARASVGSVSVAVYPVVHPIEFPPRTARHAASAWPTKPVVSKSWRKPADAPGQAGLPR
jgi:hypothetical protein